MQSAVSSETSTRKSSKKYDMHVYGWVLSFVRSYRWTLLLFVLCGFVISIAELSIPKFIQHFIDVILPQKNMSGFLLVLTALIVLIALMILAGTAKNLLQRTLSEKTSKDMQYALFRQMRKLGFSYYEKHPVGETLSLFHSEVNAVQDIYRRYLPGMINSSLMLLISATLMVSIDLRMSLMILPCFFSYYLFGPYFEKKAALWSKDAVERRNEANKKLYDSVSSLLELRAYGRSSWDIGNLIGKLEIQHRTQLRAYLYAYLRGTVRRLTTYFGAIFVFVYGIYLVQEGSVSIGEFVAFSFYYFRVMGDITGLVTLTTEQRIILAQADRLYCFMKQTPDVADPEKPVRLPNINGEIGFRNVHFGYPGTEPIIRGFNLHIRPGQKVALVGTSGNGKSTLLKLAGRFYDPQEGDITLDGTPLRQMSLSQLRESLGYVFQETYLFGASVKDNICFGNPNATEEQVKEAAIAAQAHEFIMALPQGYDTPLGERGVRLSGGQKQRIAIARMFVKNPAVVLLDEATSALDNASEAEVQRALDKLLEGRTTLTVAHRLSTVEHYDNIVLIDEGKAAETGSYDELMDKRGAFYRLVQGQRSEEGEGER